MNVRKFLDCLTLSEKRELLILINQDYDSIISQLTINEWADIHNRDISRKLYNLLKPMGSRTNKLIIDVSDEEFLSHYSAGVKSLNELRKFVKFKGVKENNGN